MFILLFSVYYLTVEILCVVCLELWADFFTELILLCYWQKCCLVVRIFDSQLTCPVSDSSSIHCKAVSLGKFLHTPVHLFYPSFLSICIIWYRVLDKLLLCSLAGKIITVSAESSDNLLPGLCYYVVATIVYLVLTRV